MDNFDFIKELTLRNINVKADISEIIKEEARAKQKLEEKKLALNFLLEIKKQDVELVKYLAEIKKEELKTAREHCLKEADEIERSMQYQRIFGFRSRADIREEAEERAIRQTKRLYEELSVLNTPDIKKMIESRTSAGKAIESLLNQNKIGYKSDDDDNEIIVVD